MSGVFTRGDLPAHEPLPDSMTIGQLREEAARLFPCFDAYSRETMLWLENGVIGTRTDWTGNAPRTDRGPCLKASLLGDVHTILLTRYLLMVVMGLPSPSCEQRASESASKQ